MFGAIHKHFFGLKLKVTSFFLKFAGSSSFDDLVEFFIELFDNDSNCV